MRSRRYALIIESSDVRMWVHERRKEGWKKSTDGKEHIYHCYVLAVPLCTLLLCFPGHGKWKMADFHYNSFWCTSGGERSEKTSICCSDIKICSNSHIRTANLSPLQYGRLYFINPTINDLYLICAGLNIHNIGKCMDFNKGTMGVSRVETVFKVWKQKI